MSMERKFTTVVINKSQKYALQLNEFTPESESSEASTWVFPKGEIAEGEKPEAAAARAFMDDFDIPAKTSEFQKVGMYNYEDEDVIILTYTGSESPRHSNTGDSFQYFSLQEIHEVPLHFSQEQLLPFLESFEREAASS